MSTVADPPKYYFLYLKKNDGQIDPQNNKLRGTYSEQYGSYNIVIVSINYCNSAPNIFQQWISYNTLYTFCIPFHKLENKFEII